MKTWKKVNFPLLSLFFTAKLETLNPDLLNSNPMSPEGAWTKSKDDTAGNITDGDSRYQVIAQLKSELTKSQIIALKEAILKEEREKDNVITQIKKTNNQSNGVAWTICQEDFEEDQNVLQLECGKTHIFHFSWLKEWMTFKFVWPSWRTNLQTLYQEKIKLNISDRELDIK